MRRVAKEAVIDLPTYLASKVPKPSETGGDASGTIAKGASPTIIDVEAEHVDDP